MHAAVGNFFDVSVIVVGEAGWACCDELVECPDGLVVSVLDVVCHQVDYFL